MKALIVGCGYLGRRVADRWLAVGHEVAALTRSPAKANELRAAGIQPILGDVTDRNSLDRLPTADLLLYAVGYDRSAGRDRREVVLDGLRNTLDATAGKVAGLVFISTTSVYGESNGGWIDESTPPAPQTEAGRLALQAESLLREPPPHGSSPPPLVPPSPTPHTTLRLSGLYGPGRLLRRVEQLRAREPIPGDGEAWLNLIHVEDAATAVLLAADRLLRQSRKPPSEAPTATPDLFLVSDDCPVRRRDYYARLAELTDSPPSLFDPAQETRSAGLGKRCRNTRAKRDLALTLAYPTFEEGLTAALSEEAAP